MIKKLFLLFLAVFLLAGCAETRRPEVTQQEIPSRFEPLPRYVYYRENTTLEEAKLVRDAVIRIICQTTPVYKLTNSYYVEFLFEQKIKALGFKGINSPYLPKNYIHEQTGGILMAGLP